MIISSSELMKLYYHIGVRVKLRRLFMQLSQQDVAREGKITVAMLERIECGQIRAPSYFLRRHAKLCKVPVTWFFIRTLPSDGPGLPTDEDMSNIVPFKRTKSEARQATKVKQAA